MDDIGRIRVWGRVRSCRRSFSTVEFYMLENACLIASNQRS